MSVHLRSLHWSALEELRHEPIEKRIRATIGDETVVDTTRALLVYEPKRVVPSYAVPERDLTAELVESQGPVSAAEHPVALGEVPAVLDPSTHGQENAGPYLTEHWNHSPAPIHPKLADNQVI